MTITFKLKLLKFVAIAVFAASVTACASNHVVASTQPKEGFSNITDIPMPQSASIDMSKTVIMGGNNKWTGHLVYTTSKPQPLVLDFINDEMQKTGWTKVSELRGNESILTFVKERRIATIRIIKEGHYLSSNSVVVAVDMTYYNMKPVELESRNDDN